MTYFSQYLTPVLLVASKISSPFGKRGFAFSMNDSISSSWKYSKTPETMISVGSVLSAMMYFYVDDAKEFAKKAGCELIERRDFYTDARKIIGRKTGLYTRIAMLVCDNTGRAIILHLKLN